MEKAEEARSGQFANAQMLLTGQFVDLDLFAEGKTVYEFTDAAGERRAYELPNDVPLPLGLAFLRAHDVWYAAVVKLAQAKGQKAEERVLRSVEQEWERLLTAFLSIARIRKPDASLEEFRDQIGHTVMAAWLNTLVTRLQMTQANSSFEAFLAKLLTPVEEAEDPKAQSRSGSSN